jgi:membrane protein YdbS with pleckstrin-like domain
MNLHCCFLVTKRRDNTIYTLNQGKFEEFIKLCLFGLLPAIALFLGQYFIYKNIELLIASVGCIVLFIFLAFIFIIDKWRTI